MPTQRPCSRRGSTRTRSIEKARGNDREISRKRYEYGQRSLLDQIRGDDRPVFIPYLRMHELLMAAEHQQRENDDAGDAVLARKPGEWHTLLPPNREFHRAHSVLRQSFKRRGSLVVLCVGAGQEPTSAALRRTHPGARICAERLRALSPWATRKPSAKARAMVPKRCDTPNFMPFQDLNESTLSVISPSLRLPTTWEGS